jgi:hypothetical protein
MNILNNEFPKVDDFNDNLTVPGWPAAIWQAYFNIARNLTWFHCTLFIIYPFPLQENNKQCELNYLA